MSIHEINNQPSKIRRIPREAVEKDEQSLRSLEISQMRILARKRPKEYLKIAAEIHLDIKDAIAA